MKDEGKYFSNLIEECCAAVVRASEARDMERVKYNCLQKKSKSFLYSVFCLSGRAGKKGGVKEHILERKKGSCNLLSSVRTFHSVPAGSAGFCNLRHFLFLGENLCDFCVLLNRNGNITC